MKALVWKGPRIMTLDEVAPAEAGPGEVLIRVGVVAICGSELSGYLGQNSLRVPPLVMGHEFAGTVVSLGSGVTGLPVGARVSVNPLISCDRCSVCRSGLANLCPERSLIGAHRSGAFAEHVAVPVSACHTLPPGMDLAMGALAEPIACAVRAVGLGGVGLGSRVLIIGAGPIGLLTAAVALRAGAGWVGITDTNPARLVVAKRWGVHSVIDPRNESAANAVRTQIDSGGVDVAIDAVGHAATRSEAVSSVHLGGRVVLVGLHQSEMALDGNFIVRNEIHMTGCFAYTPADFATACELLSANLVRPLAEWTVVRPLAQGPQSFAELVDTQPVVTKILLQPGEREKAGL
jgi:2-desacetyl-2-hydroxyethyl bacteriochlorophyllide A dehydrogenase